MQEHVHFMNFIFAGNETVIISIIGKCSAISEIYISTLLLDDFFFYLFFYSFIYSLVLGSVLLFISVLVSLRRGRRLDS